MTIPNNYLRAINRKPEPMRVWCKDCQVFHWAGECAKQAKAIREEATAIGQAIVGNASTEEARNWPGEHDYTGMCSVCQNRFCGNKVQVIGRRCHFCHQQKMACAAPETGSGWREPIKTTHDSQTNENHAHDPASNPQPKRPFRHEPLGASKGEEENAGRIVVRVVSYRRRLIDPDNLTPKYFIDALRYRCLIPGDSAKDIIYSVRQEKVSEKAQERTEITIEYP